MTARRNISTATPWETRFSYSRVVVAGGLVFVSGTVAADHAGRIHAPGDAAGQARYVYEKIGRALAVASLAAPECLLEIEVDAILPVVGV